MWIKQGRPTSSLRYPATQTNASGRVSKQSNLHDVQPVLWGPEDVINHESCADNTQTLYLAYTAKGAHYNVYVNDTLLKLPEKLR